MLLEDGRQLQEEYTEADVALKEQALREDGSIRYREDRERVGTVPEGIVWVEKLKSRVYWVCTRVR